MDWSFLIKSILLGVGLAMDAFSVSLANGLHEPKMRTGKILRIAGIFAAFQAVMPMAGWLCIHTIASYFAMFQKWIPWIALVLLVYIGGKMLLEGIRGDCQGPDSCAIGISGLLIQGVATSIDALSVGFTIAEYRVASALVCAAVIAVVTFAVCTAGVLIGKKFGTKLSGKASVLGGLILIGIGIEIFITGVF